MTTQSKLLGFEDPGDRKVGVRVREWNALKLAAWRNRRGWGSVEHRALEMIERCKHSEGCPGEEVATEPCLPDCPHREFRMDALVMLNDARTCAPADARKPAEGGVWSPPTREYFSEVFAELAATQIENEALKEALRRAGVEPPSPLDEDLTPKKLMPTASEPQLEEHRKNS